MEIDAAAAELLYIRCGGGRLVRRLRPEIIENYSTTVGRFGGG